MDRVKSSIHTDTDIDGFGGSVWIINPDLLTARIQKIERLKPRAANIAAVTRIYGWLEASIAAHQQLALKQFSLRKNIVRSSSRQRLTASRCG
jgi:predicted ABC-type ATPase